MTWFYEALELMNADGARSGRFRVCKTSDEDGGGPYGLCDCEGGHESQDAARDCPIAKAKLSIAFPSHVEAVAPQMAEVDALEKKWNGPLLIDDEGLVIGEIFSTLRTAIRACEKQKQRADDAEKESRKVECCTCGHEMVEVDGQFGCEHCDHEYDETCVCWRCEHSREHEGMKSKNATLTAERDEAREQLDHILSCIITVRQENTPEWMEYIVEEVNKVNEAMGDSDRVIVDRDGIRIVKQESKP